MTEWTLGQFVEELAADLPSPAAGSATAAVAAMAAALTELAARRSGDEDRAARAAVLRGRLLPLVEEDARAYGEVLRAEGDERREALRRASEVLESVRSAAGEVGELARAIAEHGNPNLRGEAIAAQELAGAADRIAAALIGLNCG